MYVDFEGFPTVILFTLKVYMPCLEKKICFKIKLLVNQDGVSVGEEWHFCWKIKYFCLFNINFISLHSLYEILNQSNLSAKIMGKFKINVTFQDFYKKFCLSYKNRNNKIEVNRWADSFFCLIMKQTLNKKASGPIKIHTFGSSNFCHTR